MTTIKAVQTTIKLGDIELNAFQLSNGSYAASGLFRLMDTNVYRYQGCWYWVSPDGLPALEEYTHLDRQRDAYLSFDGNKLSYLHFNSVEPGRDVCEEDAEFHYTPVSNDVREVIEFCLLGKLLPGETTCKLLGTYEKCYEGALFRRAIYANALLSDTSHTFTAVED
jgi:hypothetical protein